MIRHIVLFTLEGFPSETEKRVHLLQIKDALEALPDEIEGLKGMKVFLNENAEEPYDFLLEAFLERLEDLPLYAEHPAHMKVVQELIAPYKSARAAIDFTDDSNFIEAVPQYLTL